MNLKKYITLLIESEIDKQLLDKVKDVKIQNPKSKRDIKVSTALSSKNHPAYSTALKYLQSQEEGDEAETVEQIDKKIEQLKKDYQSAQDNMEFDKVSSIVKSIQDLNKKKQELVGKSEQDNKKKLNDINNKIDVLKKEYQQAQDNLEFDKISSIVKKIQDLNLEKSKLDIKDEKPKETKKDIKNHGIKFKDKKEIENHFNKMYNDIPDKLKPKQKQAAGFYRSDEGYTNMNGFLRNKTPIDNKTKQTIKELNNAIKSNKIKEDISLYRGLQLNNKLKEQLSKLKPGDTFIDNGFSSTSLDEERTKKEFGGNREGTAIFQINAKKGQSGLPMENISTGNPDDDEGFKGEFEMLLPAKSKFKLVGIEGNKYIFEIDE